jgi:multidrug resistance efflux pump
VLAAAAAAVVLLAVAGTAYALLKHPFRQLRPDLVLYTVHPQRLELTITERGTLESAKNNDIYCRVKAKSQGGNGTASTITWVIDDGSHVKKGDLLVSLDDSGLQDQLKTQKVTIDTKESDKVQAEEQYKIQISQNESDIKKAETDLEIARIDMDKYLQGEFPAALKDIDGKIKVAESDVEQQRERVAWVNRMVRKGYQTPSQAQAEVSRMESLVLTLKKNLEDKRVLTDPAFGTKKRTETFNHNTVIQAELALERARSSAKASEIKARVDREAKKSVYDQELARYKEIQEEITKCKIYSPQDGMVVYFVPEQARAGAGSQQSVIAQGEPVREGMKLMQIPDLEHMMVNVSVAEVPVARVHPGQPCLIRIDSFNDRVFHGRVSQVATVASKLGWFAADVKLYATKVTIDDAESLLKPGEILKPDMSAAATLITGDPLQHVLTVPVEAVVGAAEMGTARTCFVMTNNGPEQRRVVIGETNERMAEVKSPEETESFLRKAGWTDERLAEMKLGIREGDEVVLNPRTLAGDKAKTHQPGNGKGDSDADGPSSKGAAAKEGAAAESPGAGKDKLQGPPAGPGQQPGPAGPAKAGGPAAAGGRPAGPGGGGFGSMSPEDQEKMRKQMEDRFRSLTPAKRKEMLERFPEGIRDQVKEGLKKKGIEIPD